jgi:hypothetical protein
MHIKGQVTFTRDRINEICDLYHGSHCYTLEPNVWLKIYRFVTSSSTQWANIYSLMMLKKCGKTSYEHDYLRTLLTFLFSQNDMTLTHKWPLCTILAHCYTLEPNVWLKIYRFVLLLDVIIIIWDQLTNYIQNIHEFCNDYWF